MTDQNPAPLSDADNNQTTGSYVDSYQPPAKPVTSPAAPITPPADSVTPPPAATVTPAMPGESEAIEDQNIFFMLGAQSSSDEDKETFLDEIQQIIWEDFVEKDIELLLNEEQLNHITELMSRGTDEKVQAEMIDYLEKIIPELEEIMLEKALQLKGEMFKERLNGLKEYFTGNQEALSKLNQASELMNQGLWHSAAQTVNSIDAAG